MWCTLNIPPICGSFVNSDGQVPRKVSPLSPMLNTFMTSSNAIDLLLCRKREYLPIFRRLLHHRLSHGLDTLLSRLTRVVIGLARSPLCNISCPDARPTTKRRPGETNSGRSPRPRRRNDSGVAIDVAGIANGKEQSCGCGEGRRQKGRNRDYESG